jgi:hypothetical protein
LSGERRVGSVSRSIRKSRHRAAPGIGVGDRSAAALKSDASLREIIQVHGKGRGNCTSAACAGINKKLGTQIAPVFLL